VIPAIPQPLSQQFYETINAMATGPNQPDWFRNPPTEPQAISRAERVQGLAAIWAEAKVSFAYWDRVPDLDWDAAFREYLPQVEAAEDPADYYGLLERFVAPLNESHTFIARPVWLRKQQSVPPIGLRYLEGQPVVVRGDLLPAGTVITHVDGRPAATAAAEVLPTICASRDEVRMHLACFFMLVGPKESTVTLGVRLPNGRAETLHLPRSGALPPRPLLERADLGDGRVLVRINSWADPQVVTRFDEAFPDFAGVRSLIIDLRNNGGGNSNNADRVIARLVERPVPYEISTSLLYWGNQRYNSLERLWLSGHDQPVQPEPGRPVFGGPVAVLTSPVTGSAAEDFCIAFRCNQRGLIVGETTGGSTGSPAVFPLPGGGICGISATQITFPDGTPVIGVGVAPDVAVAPTIAGLAAGRDEVLERALQVLS
jgi:C-terminal processing protease CtpA/Prc